MFTGIGCETDSKHCIKLSFIGYISMFTGVGCETKRQTIDLLLHIHKLHSNVHRSRL